MASQRIRLVKCPKCLKILQEDEDVPVYQCGGCSAILQAKKRTVAPNSTPSASETEGTQASTTSAGETERTQANEPRRELETNNVSSSSVQDMVLPVSQERSLSQEYEKDCRNASMESMEKELGGLELSNGNETNEIEEEECSLGDSEKNDEEEEEDNSRLKSDMDTVGEAEDSSGSLSVGHVEDARPSNSSGNAEITPYASPIEENQRQIDSPANKTSSAYDGSKSSSDEREDQFLDEDEEWNAFQKLRSEKFETQRYPVSYKEQGASSSTTFSEKRRNGTTAYSEWHQNRSLQLEGPGGRLGRQERRHVTEQLGPDMPFYPREPYTHVSPSYPSQDEFDRYTRAHSMQMPSYAGGMSQESVDYMYHNHTRARGRGQGFSRIPFSEEIPGDRRNHGGWHSGQLHNSYSSYSASPQRPMEQPEYYPPRWNCDIVSDAEDYQRNRHARHRHELQRQRVAKRHIRPTAGGAPFVSCYHCSDNLQLPVDFLIFKRKHHLLRCGTCTSVLRFSLQSRTHLVPVVTHDIDANRSSNSTSESPRDKAPPKPVNLSSSVQDEEITVARGSPLHRLMGYSTVSQVFKAAQRPPSV
ncbi:hypothetical protein AALP_AA8G045700 [Arabis alpina]|uniref:Uncharacterized protein n=1 Tax=Arabis alpina TaxID=50452 RepID=A0A087G4Y8_ARAAL|nr:hypothetical protein AALP_AA8G045700 [Arabis alpina]